MLALGDQTNMSSWDDRFLWRGQIIIVATGMTTQLGLVAELIRVSGR